PVMEVLASHGQPSSRRALRRFAPLLWRKLPSLVTLGLRSGMLSAPLRRPAEGAGPANRMTNVFAIGLDNARGRMVLRRGKIDILWNYHEENQSLITRQRTAMQELARHYGGTYADFPLWEHFGRTMTVHSLGGCALSETADQGVVGIDGQVHGHPGLYVADGSVIPTAIGSHPAMTISAVAERIAEGVVNSS
ncbi:MAG: GMC family oxidoreductase, partial [Acidimicrobiia bacterium]